MDLYLQNADFFLKKTVKTILQCLFLIGFLNFQSFSQSCTETADVVDNQAAAGTNSWIGHVYTWTGSAPPTNAFASANYKGNFTNPVNFNNGFGGDVVCFNVTNNGANNSVLTTTFAVRYRLTNTNLVGCYTATASVDDGVRLYVNGNLVINQWKEQGTTTYTATISLTGNDNLVLEYYENAGQNVCNFSLTPVNIVTAPNACIGGGNQTFTRTGANGGTWSVSGGGTITSAGVFTPQTPGCYTASYSVGGCIGTKQFIVFPTAPVISAPTNVCASAFSLPSVPAQNGFTVQYSIDGGAYSASPTIPTTPGCHTISARYALSAACGTNAAGTVGTGGCGVSNTVSVVIFPNAPTIAAISNTCQNALALPSVPAVSGFNVEYSIDGNPYASATTGPSTVGCHYIRARYVLAATCGSTSAGVGSTGACEFSNTVYGVVFPQAPSAPSVNTTGSNIVVTPPPVISGFEPQYSYDNGSTWTTENNGPSADNCTGYQVKTRYTAQGCGSAPSLTPINIAPCDASLATLAIRDVTPPSLTCPGNQTGTVGVNCNKIVTGLLPTATDNCNIASITYTISGVTTGSGTNDASGTNFNLGLSTVTYTATDGSGNTTTCSFTVTLTDNTPPTINCLPNQTIELSNACTTTMPNYAAQAVTLDNCWASNCNTKPGCGKYNLQ